MAAAWLRSVALIGLAAGALLGAMPAHADVTITAFGQQISAPEYMPKDTVLARYYITPQQMCGGPTCSFEHMSIYVNGGSVVLPGPTVTTNVSGVSTRILLNGQVYPTSKTQVIVTQPIEVQLLADGRPIVGGSLAGSYSNPAYFLLYEPQKTVFIALSGQITPITGACSVREQTVTLSPVNQQQFGDIGSTAGAKNFEINVDHCPQGYNQIGYTLDPGSVIDSLPGALPRGAGDTAKSVQIRIADPTGKPVTFNHSIKLDKYDKSTGGSYTIPLQASYIKTGPAVQPGSVSGAMVVRMDYQ
ncbi:fimbrial protein [Burkholderia pyrrocinia]